MLLMTQGMINQHWKTKYVIHKYFLSYLYEIGQNISIISNYICILRSQGKLLKSP